MFDALFSIYLFLATLYTLLDIASSVSSFFSQYWAEIIIVVVGDIAAILVAEMLFERIQRRRSKPKIEIGITEDELGDRIGFLIFSRNKTLKEARARCNDISYPWEEKDGSKLSKKDIFVGDEPSVFYPFAWQYVLLPQDKLDEYREEKFVVLYIDGNRELNYEDYQGAYMLTIREVTKDRVVQRIFIPIPKQMPEMTAVSIGKTFEVFKAKIRIIAEGIEEQKDYTVSMLLNEAMINALSARTSTLSFDFAIRGEGAIR